MWKNLRQLSISTVPCNTPESYIRFSVTFEAKDQKEERRIINEVKNRLLELELIF